MDSAPWQFASALAKSTHLLAQDSQLNEHIIVKSWLEMTAPDFAACNSKRDFGKATFKKNGPIHPDRPLEGEDLVLLAANRTKSV